MKDVEMIYVVCGEAGKPHRAYKEREHAEELLDHWREGPMNVRGSIETVDLVEFRETAPELAAGSGETGDK